MSEHFLSSPARDGHKSADSWRVPAETRTRYLRTRYRLTSPAQYITQ